MIRHSRITTFAVTVFFLAAFSGISTADFFGPSDLEKCTNEKVAVELKYKYCYRDKTNTENELELLKRQYRNESANFRTQINSLENKISSLQKKLDSSVSGREQDNSVSSKKISELENTLAILRNNSTGREKELLNEIEELQKKHGSELTQLRDSFDKERNRLMEEIDRLKNDHASKLAELNSQISNLNSELALLKKLTESQKEELERMSTQEKELARQLESEIKKGDIRLKKHHDRLIINIDNRISFDSGSAELKKEVFSALDKISGILQNYPENRIMVEGHTDTDKIVRGKYRDNWHLSAERALAVLNQLLKNKNIDRSRFAAAGYGEFNPIVPNDTPENKALNRRVDIVVIPRVSSK